MYTSYTIPLSVFCFWIRGQFALTENAVDIAIPNRLFGCIPVGSAKSSIPLRSISGCRLDTWYSGGEILAGIVLLIAAGCLSVYSVILGLFVAVFAMGVLLSSIHTVLVIQNNGTDMSVSVPFYGRKQMTAFANALSAAIRK